MIVVPLVVWRLTYDFVALDGPFGLYRWIRERVGNSNVSWLREGITCGYCVSFWVGLVVTLAVPGLSWRDYILFSLASSGAVTLFARYLKSMYGADLFD